MYMYICIQIHACIIVCMYSYMYMYMSDMSPFNTTCVCFGVTNSKKDALQHTATHCNTLAIHCNTLQCLATRGITHFHTICMYFYDLISEKDALQHTTTHCNTLATYCNTLQHTATRGMTHFHVTGVCFSIRQKCVFKNESRHTRLKCAALLIFTRGVLFLFEF